MTAHCVAVRPALNHDLSTCVHPDRSCDLFNQLAKTYSGFFRKGLQQKAPRIELPSSVKHPWTTDIGILLFYRHQASKRKPTFRPTALVHFFKSVASALAGYVSRPHGLDFSVQFEYI